MSDTSQTQAPQGRQRLHHLDVLRALLMLQILPFHAGSIYAIVPEWLVISHDRSWLVTGIIGWFGIFSMTGFFMVSSWLTIYFLRRRDVGTWMSIRLQRLGIPILTAMLTLSPLAMIAGALAARLDTPVAEAWGFTGDIGDDLLTGGHNWVGHLWFLITLLLYSCCVWFLARRGWFRPSLNLLAKPFETWSTPLRSWLAIMLIAAGWKAGVLLIFYILRHGYGLESPFFIFLDIKNWLLYIPAFVLGLMIGQNETLRDHLMRVTPGRILFAAAGACYLVFMPQAQTPAGKLVYALLDGSVAIATCLIIIPALERVITREHGWAKFCSRHAYSVYLVHYPIVAFMGVGFMLVDWPPVAEFAIICLIGFTMSFSLAILISRLPLLTLLYNGVPMKQRKTGEQRRSASSPILPETGRY